ncbi:hypothetical protein GCM10010339_93640 [Streptomyces alanosinicus]|uniref:Uncharacterized protein n=1 Tax=Streptomyces alanosinicus TaxID=68171 RepID=A0A918MI14_9ACTN|nr:hypothetical protein GCM10010339_93640 [Streptomyces alanosinicus]
MQWILIDLVGFPTRHRLIGRGVVAERALQRAPCGMSGGRPAVSYRTVVLLDTLCDTYGLADEVIGDPAGAAESGAPA